METRIQESVDIHAHILPGVDDGAKNMDTAREMLRRAWSEGIRAVVATPHCGGGYPHVSAGELKKAYQMVREEAQKIDPGFKVYLGSELFNSHSLGEDLTAGKALTMAGTDYVLVEFQPSESYRGLCSSLKKLQMDGYRPVIAHAERYACLVKEPALTEELVKMGCYIQVNTSSVIGQNGFAAKRYIRTLLKYERVHFLGTDAHDLGKRKPMMRKSIVYIAKKFGEGYARQVCWENAEKLLQNQTI